MTGEFSHQFTQLGENQPIQAVFIDVASSKLTVGP
jgi:hypothetical protein